MKKAQTSCALFSELSDPNNLVVVFLPEMGDQIFADHPAQGVLQLHQLDEQVVLWVEFRGGHRRLEVETQPLLDATHPGALREIEEQNQVENNRCRKNRIAAEEVHLDLHRIAEPPEDVDVVPTLFVVAAGRVVVNAHLVVDRSE